MQDEGCQLIAELCAPEPMGAQEPISPYRGWRRAAALIAEPGGVFDGRTLGVLLGVLLGLSQALLGTPRS